MPNCAQQHCGPEKMSERAQAQSGNSDRDGSILYYALPCGYSVGLCAGYGQGQGAGGDVFRQMPLGTCNANLSRRCRETVKGYSCRRGKTGGGDA